MQIYENLLSNSIRYAKSDIAISVVIENNNLVISVSDDGCGFKNIEIEKAGYEVTTPVIVTNSYEFSEIETVAFKQVERQNALLKVQRI